MQQGKDRVPPAIKQILAVDAQLTQKFVLWTNNFLPLRSLRVHYKLLEVSCHGIPWFAFWIGFTWLFNNPSLVQLQVNMLLGLFLDILFVAISKAYFRRKRPVANTDDALGQIGPDVYSFPSGHASRAVFVTFLFINLYPLPWYCWPSLMAWTSCICLSRILMNRHHILDVVAGIVLGLLIGCVMSIVWIEEGTAQWLMNYLSDEKNDGGDYHV